MILITEYCPLFPVWLCLLPITKPPLPAIVQVPEVNCKTVILNPLGKDASKVIVTVPVTPITLAFHVAVFDESKVKFTEVPAKFGIKF